MTKNPQASSLSAYAGIGILASVLTTGLVGPEPVNAQEGQIEEVTVTGTRIVRRDFEANSPIMTVEATRFEESSTIAIESVINQLPQFVPAVTQFGGGEGGGARAETGSTLSLRGLGANRNLVLLDGRRAMPMNAGMAVNINTIPSAAIERVETITGGASSVYGADAIAGVVNFILRRDFEGLDINTQFGETLEGDGSESLFSVLMGSTFSSGNVMLGFEATKRGQVYKQDRDFYVEGWADPRSAAGTTQFHSAPGPVPQADNLWSQEAIDAVFSEAAPGSVTPTGAFYLNPDGTLYKTSSDGAYRYNGPTHTADGHVWRFIREDDTPGAIGQNQQYQVIQNPMDRYSLFGRANIALGSSLSAFGQVSFSEIETETIGGDCCLSGGWRSKAPHGNGIYAPSVDENGNTRPAYLAGGVHGLNCPPVGGCTKTQAFPVSPELEVLLASRPDPEADWHFRISSTWEGPRRSYIATTNYQLVAGLEGELPIKDWTWELYTSFGSTRTAETMRGRTALQRWRFVTSQPNYGTGMFITGNELGDGFSAGNATCTSGYQTFHYGEMYYPWGMERPDAATGTQPSQDCQDAVNAVAKSSGHMKQTITEYNMQGGIMDMPAGELRFALGATHRENTFQWLADTLNTSDSFLDLPAGFFPRDNTEGATTAAELYGELLVPLLANKPGVNEMSLELGYRTANNDPSDNVDSWKALLDWQFTDRVRFRGGKQTAHRAPNIAELFQSSEQQTLFSPRGDWCSDLNPTNTLAPNPNLNPNAAQVRALCEAIMGPGAAATYYSNPDRSSSATQWRFSDLVGNPEVETEAAETLTLGIVADIADRTRLSVDYWRIQITDMIAAQHPDVIHTQCFSPETNPTFDPNLPACRQIVRDPSTGNQANASILFTNEGAIDFAGYDLQLDWSGDVGPGMITLNFLATIADTMKTQVDPAAEWNDWKGTSGPGDLTGVQSFAYDYRTFTTIGYQTGTWTTSLRWRHLPSIESEANVGNPFSTDRPTGSYNMFDLAGRYSMNERWSLRGGIDNLFDTQPERTFASDEYSGAGDTNPNFYDILGRRVYVGASVQF